MAKSDNASGGKGETHYKRKEKVGSKGPAAGKKPQDENADRRSGSDEESRPYTRKPIGEKRTYRKPEGERSYPEGRAERGREERPADKKAYGEKKPFRKDGDKPYERKSFGDKKPFRKEGDAGERRPYGDRKPPKRDGEKPYERKSSTEKRPFNKDRDNSKKPFDRERGDKKPYAERSPRPGAGSGDRPEKRAYVKRAADQSEDGRPARKPFARKTDAGGERSARPTDRKAGGDKPFSRRDEQRPFDRNRPSGKAYPPKKTHFDGDEFVENSNPAKPGKWDTEAKTGPMTLNKYLAHSGVSSRRDAAAMIKEGKVMVNGEVLTEPGYRVKPEDVITMDGKKMTPQRDFVYVLLNKPKDFLTTTEDDRGRRTVMELVAGATEDRLYPIGRLDRNTTGVLLLTNDGDLAQRLSHPKFESKKIYQVTLNKDVTKKDFDQIVEGVVLEDGPAKVDRLAYLEKKNEIGLEIHTGRNRIVRRIFESLGYDVERLDRVMYAGLTKKNVSRGKWRFLTEKEVINLKYFKK